MATRRDGLLPESLARTNRSEAPANGPSSGLLMGGIPLYTRRQSQWLTAHQPSVPITSV